MFSWIGQWVDKLLNVPPWIALLVIAVLCLAEAGLFIGFVLPGETAVIIGGVLASYGRVPLWLVMVVVIGSATIGDSIGYEVGRHFGPRMLRMGPLKKHHAKIDAAQEFLRRRGGRAVLIGRFTAFLRAVMPALAGVSKIPYGRFLVFNFTGAVVWGGGCVLLGYLAGRSFKTVAHDVGLGSTIFVGVVVVLLLVAWHLRRRRTE